MLEIAESTHAISIPKMDREWTAVQRPFQPSPARRCSHHRIGMRGFRAEIFLRLSKTIELSAVPKSPPHRRRSIKTATHNAEDKQEKCFRGLGTVFRQRIFLRGSCCALPWSDFFFFRCCVREKCSTKKKKNVGEKQQAKDDKEEFVENLLLGRGDSCLARQKARIFF